MYRKSGEIPPCNKKLGMLKNSKSWFIASSSSLLTDQHMLRTPLPLPPEFTFSCIASLTGFKKLSLWASSHRLCSSLYLTRFLSNLHPKYSFSFCTFDSIHFQELSSGISSLCSTYFWRLYEKWEAIEKSTPAVHSPQWYLMCTEDWRFSCLDISNSDPA